MSDRSAAAGSVWLDWRHHVVPPAAKAGRFATRTLGFRAPGSNGRPWSHGCGARSIPPRPGAKRPW